MGYDTMAKISRRPRPLFALGICRYYLPSDVFDYFRIEISGACLLAVFRVPETDAIGIKTAIGWKQYYWPRLRKSGVS